MAKRQTWVDQLSRIIMPLLVVAIGIYGAWDLVIQPLIPVERLTTNACETTIIDVSVLKPSTNPNQPPKRINAPEGLPIVVPANEKRIISVVINNPNEKPVVYQWKATTGQFESRVSVDGESTYVAPNSLVNDTITVEATLQGCSFAQRTIKIAVVPSATAPLGDQPIPEPSFDSLSPAQPSPSSDFVPLPSP